MNNRLSLQRFLVIVTIIVVVGYILITIFPFFWIAITSFKSEREIAGITPYRLFAENPTLNSYSTIIVQKNFLRAILNSFIVGICTSLYIVIISSMSGYIISRFRFKGRDMLMGLILSVSMFPQIIVVRPVYNMFFKLGLLNTFWVAAGFCTITLPLAVWIMTAHFRQIPIALEEAARIDGCSSWKCLWYVVFPIAAPGAFTTAIMSFITAWNEYLISHTLNIRESMRSVPVAIASFRDEYFIFWGEISAAVVLAVLPSMTIVLLFQKQIISGIISGAVKE